MTTFDDREHAFEKKYAHDQDMVFRATASRNRAAGLWAAAKLEMHGHEAEAYAKAVVAAGIAKPGDAVVIDKLDADLRSAHPAVSRTDIAAVLAQFGRDATIAVRR